MDRSGTKSASTFHITPEAGIGQAERNAFLIPLGLWLRGQRFHPVTGRIRRWHFMR